MSSSIGFSNVSFYCCLVRSITFTKNLKEECGKKYRALCFGLLGSNKFTLRGFIICKTLFFWDFFLIARKLIFSAEGIKTNQIFFSLVLHNFTTLCQHFFIVFGLCFSSINRDSPSIFSSSVFQY